MLRSVYQCIVCCHSKSLWRFPNHQFLFPFLDIFFCSFLSEKKCVNWFVSVKAEFSLAATSIAWPLLQSFNCFSSSLPCHNPACPSQQSQSMAVNLRIAQETRKLVSPKPFQQISSTKKSWLNTKHWLSYSVSDSLLIAYSCNLQTAIYSLDASTCWILLLVEYSDTLNIHTHKAFKRVVITRAQFNKFWTKLFRIFHHNLLEKNKTAHFSF